MRTCLSHLVLAQIYRVETHLSQLSQTCIRKCYQTAELHRILQRDNRLDQHKPRIPEERAEGCPWTVSRRSQ